MGWPAHRRLVGVGGYVSHSRGGGGGGGGGGGVINEGSCCE